MSLLDRILGFAYAKAAYLFNTSHFTRATGSGGDPDTIAIKLPNPEGSAAGQMNYWDGSAWVIRTNVSLSSGYIGLGPDPAAGTFAALGLSNQNAIVGKAAGTGNPAYLVTWDSGNNLLVGEDADVANLKLRALTSVVVRAGSVDAVTVTGSGATFAWGSAPVVVGSGYVATGIDPAETGGVRLTNGNSNGIYSKNFSGNTASIAFGDTSNDYLYVGDGNDWDRLLLYCASSFRLNVGGANQVVVTPSTTTIDHGTNVAVFGDGYLSVASGGNAAGSGGNGLRLSNNAGVYHATTGGGLNTSLFFTAFDVLEVGDDSDTAALSLKSAGTTSIRSGGATILTVSATKVEFSFGAGNVEIGAGYVLIPTELRSSATISASSLGTVTNKLPIYNASGALIGYAPIYDTIT